jgi:hypothetical protein
MIIVMDDVALRDRLARVAERPVEIVEGVVSGAVRAIGEIGCSAPGDDRVVRTSESECVNPSPSSARRRSLSRSSVTRSVSRPDVRASSLRRSSFRSMLPPARCNQIYVRTVSAEGAKAGPSAVGKRAVMECGS